MQQAHTGNRAWVKVNGELHKTYIAKKQHGMGAARKLARLFATNFKVLKTTKFVLSEIGKPVSLFCKLSFKILLLSLIKIESREALCGFMFS